MGTRSCVIDSLTLSRHSSPIQVQYVIDHMAHREGLKPLADEGEEEEEETEDGGSSGAAPPRRVLVVGAGAAGLAAASTLKVR